jgi:hypothetical protein
MVTETTNIDEQLLPARYPQKDLFICDVADAVLKDLMPQLEHPFYSLSKKPETQIRRYEHNGNWLEITPSVKGLATIYDKDILIYCISMLMDALKRKEKVSPRVRINCRELLMFTNRGTAGPNYQALCEAIDRLAGTRITTNIKTGDEEQYENFGLIDAGSIRRKYGNKGRLLWVEVKLSDWVFNAIRAQEVLTLHPDYFRLRKPLERRVYEIARKHCGRQDSWSISTALLLKKSGSSSPLKRFRQMIKFITKHNHLPDYEVRYDTELDQISFYNRVKWWEDETKSPPPPSALSFTGTQVFETAKKYAGNSVYEWYEDWKVWFVDSGQEPPHNPEAAFIGFCKKRARRVQSR